MSKYIRIRKQGRSLYLPLPYEFVHDNGLIAGDFVLFDPAQFKIAKQSMIDLVAEPAVVSEASEEAVTGE